mgnify:CR=1 FL=1
MRGEKPFFHSPLLFIIGSSPRAWGKGKLSAPSTKGNRIIPTCVGKSADDRGDGVRISDHPHVRGEKAHFTRPRVKIAGSSPRAWGKVRWRSLPASARRIIPTCVGKRRAGAVLLLVRTDHPHVRGEKMSRAADAASLSGSSPRAWGKDAVAGCFGSPRRIIPTCVGKSTPSSSRWRIQSDHPHVRGEKSSSISLFSGIHGSSPRAWGKARGHAAASSAERIIPTCVGKSMASILRRTAFTDHPHVRGEKGVWKLKLFDRLGSSPRAWGKDHDWYPYLFRSRIIPTCVGKRRKQRRKMCRTEDHPHVRGEKSNSYP